MPFSRAFFAKSALAFAVAQLLTAALHKTGHGLAAQILGFSPKIYGFYEDNPNGTVVIALATPAARAMFAVTPQRWNVATLRTKPTPWMSRGADADLFVFSRGLPV